MKKYNTTTYVLNTVCGKMYALFIFDGDKLHAIQIVFGKSGTCARTHLEFSAHLLTTIVNELPSNKALNALLKASGHTCQGGFEEGTCSDVLIKLIIEKFYLNKHKED